MPTRNYVTDPQKLLAEGQMIVASTDDAKFQHKVECVNIVLGGMMPSELSNYVAESKNTITLWVKIADEQGFDALHTKKQTGRPTKLTKEQLDEIEAVLKEDDPGRYGYRVWDGPSLSDYIQKKYSVKITVRHCQRMFHSMGFSLVRPQTYPSLGEANEKERKDFKKK